MRRMLLALLLLTLIGSPANAARNANGAMVLHTNDAISFSAGTDYCDEGPLPATCAELNTRSDKPVDTVESIIWVIGAWYPAATPGVNGFQFGIYHNLPAGYFSAWSLCGPGALEIPDATWPSQSGTGTAVAFNTSVYPPNNLMKLYWFAAIGAAGGFVSSGAYPHGPMVAQFVDDSYPPQTDDVHRFGTVRWGAPGANECPPETPPPTGACCFHDGTCIVLTPAECQARQGTYRGNNTSCLPNPCVQPTGACCFRYGQCSVLTQAQCTDQSGTSWTMDGTCNPNPCGMPTGACCFPDGHCMVVTQSGCDQLCGTYQGDNTACAPNPCSARGFVGRETSYAPLRSNPFARGNGAPLFLGGRNAGGAMLLHVDNSICYSPGTDYCSTDPLPATCEGLVTNATRDPSVEALIWMVAAFPSNSSPGVNAFQVGITGDIPVDDFAAFGSCGPGVLEIPDPTWPSPGTGTACAFASTAYDRLFKMYWFAVTAPGTGSSLSTTGYPHGDQNAEWADDSTPPRVDVCNNFGRVVWGGHGQNQCPGPIHQGACCFLDGSCRVQMQADCTGQYMGDNAVCDPNPCPPAVSGPNANGAMVVHTDDAISYSAGWDYCAQNPLPATCGDLTTRTDKPVDTVESIIWVVGAWNPTASPAVAGFQFGVYHNLPAGHFSAWAPCGPGALEIPDATWPNESETGTAVAFSAAVHPPNNLLKLYWFAAVGVTDGFVSSGAYPHGPMVAQFVDDGNPPKTDDVHLFGTVRWGAPGQNQCPCLAGTSVVLPTEWDVQWNENDNGSVRWYLGGGNEFDVHTIDGNSLRLNDTVAPLGPPVIIPSMEGFEGPVLVARFQRGEAVRSLEDQTPGPKSVFLTGSAGTGCLRATCSINLIDSGHYGTSDQDGAQSSSVFAVGAAHPNPMNAATACQISVPHVGTVTAEVYAVDGRLIRSLAHQVLPQGQHIVTWDGRADDGRPVSTGVYFIRVRYEGKMMEQRFTVLH